MLHRRLSSFWTRHDFSREIDGFQHIRDSCDLPLRGQMQEFTSIIIDLDREIVSIQLDRSIVRMMAVIATWRPITFFQGRHDAECDEWRDRRDLDGIVISFARH